MNATRTTGHLARFIRLLHTPVHLPGWGPRRKPQRSTLADAPSTLAPLSQLSALSELAELGGARRPAAQGPQALPAGDTEAPSRMTRSLAEVRADLARMREQARARAEQSQAHAQALAELRAADRTRRDIAFAPTDFMDFHAPAAPQPKQAAPQALLDNDAFARSFAATDFQEFDFDGLKTQGSARPTRFKANAFQAPNSN